MRFTAQILGQIPLEMEKFANNCLEHEIYMVTEGLALTNWENIH